VRKKKDPLNADSATMVMPACWRSAILCVSVAVTSENFFVAFRLDREDKGMAKDQPAGDTLLQTRRAAAAVVVVVVDMMKILSQLLGRNYYHYK